MRRFRWGGLLSLLVVGLLLLTLGSRAVRLPLSALRTIVRPVERLFTTTASGAGSVLTSFVHIAGLAKRVYRLEDDVSRLRGEVARRESVDQENRELRRTLDLLPASSHRLVTAEVVGVTTDGVTTALRINRGSRHGIERLDPVTAPGGSVVGRVRSVNWLDAVVELPADGAFRVAVRTIGTGAEGVVRGVRGLDVTLEGVPRTQELRSGDQLVTTGLDGVFPPHLFVGTVEAVRTSEQDIFQEARVQLPQNPRAVRFVTVIAGT